MRPGAEREQNEFYYWSEDLRKHDPRTEKNINRKASFLENMENFYNGREMVINGFKNKIIQLAGGSYFQYFEGEDKEEPVFIGYKNQKNLLNLQTI